MYLGNLLTFDYEYLQSLDLAVGELLIRKVLHKEGYDQRQLILDFVNEEDISSVEMAKGSIEGASKVFRILGYTFECSEKQQKLIDEGEIDHSFIVDLALPELDGWSAQRLNTYRTRWEDIFRETRYNRPYYKVQFKTTKARQSVLRFKISYDELVSFYYDLPTLIENFLKWKEECREVLNSDANKCQAA